MCGEFIEQNAYVFQPFLFNTNSVREHVKRSKLTGTWAEIVDIFSCTTLLQGTVFTFSLVRQQWLKSEPLFNTCTSNSMSARCLGPIILLLVYFYANVCSREMYYHRLHSPRLTSLLSAHRKPCQVRGVREYSAFVLWFLKLSVDDGQFSLAGKAFYFLSPLLNCIPSCTGWPGIRAVFASITSNKMVRTHFSAMGNFEYGSID